MDVICCIIRWVVGQYMGISTHLLTKVPPTPLMFYYIYITNGQVMQKLIIYMSVTYSQRGEKRNRSFSWMKVIFNKEKLYWVSPLSPCLLCANQFVTLMMCLNLCKNNQYNCPLHSQLLAKFWKICYYIFLACRNWFCFDN